ncbi:helix-turn-helix domain-containing protein [Planococcus sp. CP5-4]|uniref:helix-turn-helix domain-containing protein n=1 Tax=unclassified Planococcus (in: firmicutes) TaxID=2662419 RepID=UPI001C24BF99|nr:MULTISPECIES: helix-turn-helix domain-containing protein [unclassified Planococcus (in: firmicutes)]MBU9675120.1 helix-turn-helix domain-containing protein [Planococcus sp. CP5-4_YE]MBV0908079.1 helix-turn-helix domain-containing protein [Planococcus sp. CP5-4_UN]MBW6062140.1 helix-turn-helix domain-containing protein [Planococcus sp. CP5-4]
MKIMDAALPEESIHLAVEQSPVWEWIVGIVGYTHGQLRHTFEMDEEWKRDAQKMPASLLDLLATIQETNLWYGLLLLQNEFGARSIDEFVERLTGMSDEQFYEVLLPYHSRSAEVLRGEAAQRPNDDALWVQYADLFEGHAYLGGYVRELQEHSKAQLSELFFTVLSEWQDWMSEKLYIAKWLQALDFEAKQHRGLESAKAASEIKHVAGVDYAPEPSIWSVKLIPHISYRPWLLTIRTADVKLFFYPVSEQHLLDPGVPPNELIQGHKALGDELRLQLLHHLRQGPASLQEISGQFAISKTTLHHQLALLKAAKFVQVEKGVYSIRLDQLEAFSSQLTRYLGMDE